ncbi:MAG: VCBS repeat-containing protein [Gammaproteobacteria bacterium]|nr:VCBS repeat-containing protein [Gammaproteobacteria bacterium]
MMACVSAFAMHLCTAAVADDEMFAVSEFPTSGRVVRADFADFDGDGRDDLMIATLQGIPPAETRTLSIHLRQRDDSFPAEPSHSVPIPSSTAAYDIADLDPAPGEELVLLRPDRVTILSVASDEASPRDLAIPGPTTVGVAEDERGFDRLRLVYDDFGAEPWILVPQLGVVTAIAPDGRVRTVLDVGHRANYYVTRSSGLMSVETDIQLYYDAPKIAVGDIDGDGRPDLAATTRHEIRVFLQNDNGDFATTPSYAVPIGLLNREDHARGGGSVVTTVSDLDNDARLDLMISHSSGNFTDALTRTCIYHNRKGRWDLSKPEECFESEGAYSSDFLLDIDNDETLELVRVQIRFSVLEVVEFLLTREIDIHVFVHRLEADGRYDMDPWSRRKISAGMSFETFRFRGFMPTSGVDLNADGRMDFVSSADGDGIEVFLGSDEGLFARRSSLQKMPSAGVIQFLDYNDDALPDFILWDPQSFDSIVRVGRNRGTLLE